MNITKSILFCLFIILNIGCKNEKKKNIKVLSIEKQNEIDEYLEAEINHTLG